VQEVAVQSHARKRKGRCAMATRSIKLPADGHTWKEFETQDAMSFGWECACGATFTVINDQDGSHEEEYEPGDGHEE
jgi:hypothetical protein